MSIATSARLRITCPDRPGIVAATTNFLYSHNVNITSLDQHSSDPEGGTFFMRLEFQTPHLDLARSALENAFAEVVARRFEMDWRIGYGADLPRVAIFVSGQEHCLLELLWRWSRGELACEVAMVCANHAVHREAVEAFGIPYHFVPDADEDRLLELVAGQADLVILARYMRVLSGGFLSRCGAVAMNIHHSFLPAFPGADPYRQAFERGVKLIGATAHYVTEELDAGPIIEQDVCHVSHRDDVAAMKRLGRDMERQVLARAVRLHLEDRIIVHQNKTVVFR